MNAIKELKIGEYDVIQHQEMINKITDIDNKTADVKHDLDAYKKSIESAMFNMQNSISDILGNDMNNYTIDGILDMVEIIQIKKGVQSIEEQLKQIINKSEGLLNQKYKDGQILIDDLKYTVNKYAYNQISLDSPKLDMTYVGTIGVKTALKLYAQQLYMTDDTPNAKVKDTIWRHFTDVENNLINTDLDDTIAGVQFDKAILNDYYDMLNLLNQHITQYNQVINVANIRIQERYDELQTLAIQQMQTKLSNEIEEASKSISSAVENLSDFKESITKDLSDGVLNQAEIARIKQQYEDLKYRVQQARDEADDLLNAEYIDYTDEDGIEESDKETAFLLDDGGSYKFPKLKIDNSNIAQNLLTWDVYKAGEGNENGVDASECYGVKSALNIVVTLLCSLDVDGSVVENQNTVWTNFANAVDRLCEVDIDPEAPGIQIDEDCRKIYEKMYDQLMRLLSLLGDVVSAARVRMSEIYNEKQELRTTLAISALKENLETQLDEATSSINNLIDNTIGNFQNEISSYIDDSVLTQSEIKAIQQQKSALKIQVVQMVNECKDLLTQRYINDELLLNDDTEQQDLYCYVIDPAFSGLNNVVIKKSRKLEDGQYQQGGLYSQLSNALELLILPNGVDRDAIITVWDYFEKSIDMLTVDADEDESNGQQISKEALRMYHANSDVFMEHMQYVGSLVLKSKEFIQKAYDSYQKEYIDTSIFEFSEVVRGEIDATNQLIYDVSSNLESFQTNLNDFIDDGLLSVTEVGAIIQSKDQLISQISQLYSTGTSLRSQSYTDTTGNLVTLLKDSDEYEYEYFKYVPDENYKDETIRVVRKSYNGNVIGITAALGNALEMIDPSNGESLTQLYIKTVDYLVEDNDDDDTNDLPVNTKALKIWQEVVNPILCEHIEYLNSLIDDATIIIQNEYDKKQTAAISAVNEYIKGLGNDNMLDHIEKASLRNTIDALKNEHENLINVATTYTNISGVYNAMFAAKMALSNLEDYLKNTLYLYENTDTPIPDGSSVYNKMFSTYYQEKSNLETAINTAISKNAADEATEKLSETIDNLFDNLQTQISSFSASTYLNSAITQLDTEVKGGLLLTSIIELRNQNAEVIGGLSGMEYVKNNEGKYLNGVLNGEAIYSDQPDEQSKDDTLLWAGGTYEDAWKAQNGVKTLPVRITKSGVGTNIGPFKVDSDNSISVGNTMSITGSDITTDGIKIGGTVDAGKAVSLTAAGVGSKIGPFMVKDKSTITIGSNISIGNGNIITKGVQIGGTSNTSKKIIHLQDDGTGSVIGPMTVNTSSSITLDNNKVIIGRHEESVNGTTTLAISNAGAVYAYDWKNNNISKTVAMQKDGFGIYGSAMNPTKALDASSLVVIKSDLPTINDASARTSYVGREGFLTKGTDSNVVFRVYTNTSTNMVIRGVPYSKGQYVYTTKDGNTEAKLLNGQIYKQRSLLKPVVTAVTNVLQSYLSDICKLKGFKEAMDGILNNIPDEYFLMAWEGNDQTNDIGSSVGKLETLSSTVYKPEYDSSGYEVTEAASPKIPVWIGNNKDATHQSLATLQTKADDSLNTAKQAIAELKKTNKAISDVNQNVINMNTKIKDHLAGYEFTPSAVTVNGSVGLNTGSNSNFDSFGG